MILVSIPVESSVHVCDDHLLNDEDIVLDIDFDLLTETDYVREPISNKNPILSDDLISCDTV